MSSINWWPAEPHIPLLVMGAGGIGVVLGIGGISLVVVGLFVFRSLPVWVIFVGGGALIFLVGLGVLSDSMGFRSRLELEAKKAQRQMRFRDAETMEKYAAKWFIKVLKREDAIVAAHDELYNDGVWISYLERYADSGGNTVLAWYDEEIRLLEMARIVDANISFEDFRKARAQENVRVSGVTFLGEEQLQLELERLRAEREPEQPWEDAL